MSANSCRSQITSFAARDAAAYSAFVDDIATDVCLRLAHATVLSASRKTYPRVDFLSVLSPARLHRRNVEVLFSALKRVLISYEWLKQDITLLNIFQSFSVGSSIHLLNRLTVMVISGLDTVAIYNNDPIACLCIVLSAI